MTTNNTPVTPPVAHSVTPLVLDFETFYSTDYSLTKMTTASYIADPQFKIHGASVMIYKRKGQRDVRWMTGAVLDMFINSLDWSKIVLVGHNLTFDGSILSRVYNKTPLMYIDTLAMSRFVFGPTIPRHNLASAHEAVTGIAGKQKFNALVNVKGKRDLTEKELSDLGDYAKDDAVETATVLDGLIDRVPFTEMQHIDSSVRMATQPVLMLDRDRLDTFRDTILDEKEELFQRLETAGVTRDVVSSNVKFTQFLTDNGVDIDTLKSGKTGKVSLAKTNPALIDLQSSEDVVLATAVEARLASKSTIKESRAKRFISLHDACNGFMPVYLSYCGAMATCRYSATEKLNQQNLPRGEGLRSCIIAPKGHKIVALDLSQIELRINMLMCMQMDVVELLRQGQDVYCNFGTKFFGRTITKADKTERLVSKIACLSLGFGASGLAFKSMLFAQAGMIKDKAFCDSAVATYRDSHANVKRMWWKLTDAIRSMCNGVAPNVQINAPVKFETDGVLMPSGFKIKYKDIRYDLERDEYTYVRANKGGRAKIYSSVVIENICQSLARDIVMYYHGQILTALGFRMAMQVHDELIYVVPEAMAKTFMDHALNLMHVPPTFWPELPVAAEGGIGDNYADCK